MMHRAAAASDRAASAAGLALILGLALAGAFALVSFWVLDELGRNAQQRARLLNDFEVRSQINRLYADVLQAESAQRGFVITSSETFLAPYATAKADARRKIAALSGAFAESSSGRQRVAAFSRLAEAKFAEMDQVINLERSGRSARARARVAGGQGMRLMNAFRYEIDALRREQDQSIRDNVQADRRRSEVTERIVLILFIGLLMGTGVSLLLMRRYGKVRKSLMATLSEEALRERAILEAALDAVLVVGRDLRIERANSAAAEVFGTGAASALKGRRLDSVFDPSWSEAIEADLAALDRPDARAGLRREATGLRADGSGFPVEVSISRARTKDPRALLYVRDISERREVERLKDEFVSTVSHELRTPLTSIAGSLGLIAGGAAGALPPRASRLIAIAQSNSQRLVRLINDVLDLEKLEAGTLSFQFANVDLGEVAVKAAEGLKGYASQLGVEIRVQAEEPAPIRGDSDRLVQIATNLMSNAAKYSPRGGVVQVRITRENDLARLSVRDRGPGVPAAFRDRLFSRFAQADASDSRGKSGAGLGLYIARQIAERHGGRLWFESPDDGGALFHLDAPLLPDPALERPRRDEVLLVEDDPAALALLCAILEQEGVRVASASCLAEARRLLNEPGRFAALVLDLRLPDGDGMDLVRELRARPDTRGVPIVIVSADASRSREPGVKALEVVDWMEKPVDPDRLADLVRSAIDPCRSDRLLILHVDDDRDIRELVSASLAPIGEVVSADGVVQARAFLKERRPDVVVLDLELRDGDGVDLLDALSDLSTPPVPVVVFSAQDAADQLDGAVSAVLVKSRTTLSGLATAVREELAKANH